MRDLAAEARSSNIPLMDLVVILKELYRVNGNLIRNNFVFYNMIKSAVFLLFLVKKGKRAKFVEHCLEQSFI